MGMNAQIIAIGPFKRELVSHYEYPDYLYENVKEGTTIIESIIDIYSGSTESRRLAEAFDIDPWNFNRHELDLNSINKELIEEFFSDEELERLCLLRDNGFKFYFMPNG